MADRRHVGRYHAVALRKESVDRNEVSETYAAAGQAVALRKESVDRNMPENAISVFTPQSLSARRAWIEIPAPGLLFGCCLSLSARRAWIEILL